MRATHKDAEERYNLIRQGVLDELNNEFRSTNQPHLKARLIDQAALSQSRLWSRSGNRRVDWDWVEGYTLFKFRHPKRFEMALWNNAALASLSLGRPTYNGARLRLDFIEGSPDRPADLRIFPATYMAMAVYAQALGADELRVMHPINAEVRKYYETFGLIYVSKGDYLYMKL